MRLGTSGFGVIAVVSILVTAAPERKNGVGNDRGSDIDRTGGSDTERGKISRRHYSGGYRVATKSDGFDEVASTRFVKNELTRGRDIGRTWPEARTSHPSGSSTVRHNDLNIEAPTAPSRSTTDSRKLARTLGKAINFAGSAARRRVNSELIEAVAPSSPRNCEKKFHVTLDSPISDFIRVVPTIVVPGSRLRRHGEWETGMDEGETKSRDDDKISTTWENGSVRTRGERSSTVESTVTSTSIGRIAMGSTRPISNFIESKEHRAARDELDVVNKKEAIGNDLFVNSRPSIRPIFQLESRINPLELEDVSSPSYSTNYPESLVPLRFSIWNEVSLRETRENREDRGAKDTFAAYTKANDSTKLPSDEYFMRDGVANGPRQESLVGGTITTYEDKGSTARSSIDGTALRSETLDRSSVTEEIGDARQITSGWFVEVSGIATNASRLTGNLGNASDVDNTGSVNNHKAIRAGSFKATERQKPSSSFSSRSSRIPERQGVKDAFAHLAKETPGVKTNRTTATVNQIAFPKSSFPVTKNATKQSINLVDGRVNKIFYEIKPSLITDMDRGDDIDVTTTTRRSVDRFLPPSVPSALGKFGPYFLDEEDRRNVTERIGNTVQLDCRIGLLGHRKVTWLQHYKDSFRLLTVERESYSVDRRISLNFQYPDNWRLQIAYASMRDSGLYKCQVEIDHARSLVKCYNVTITAPILTITDDSGRPVSGERHLKAGSTLKLRCEARDVVQRLNESVLWMRGDETLTDDVSENKTTEIVNENEVTVVISTLLVERAIPRHAGNYSCVVPDKARTTIAVHVLNGELPAAVQHGSGVSTAVLNLWLIHLTASYGFFR